MTRGDRAIDWAYPCPNLVLEAIAAGRPVVASASGGRPERLVQALVAVVGWALARCGYVAGGAQLARGRRAKILTTGLGAADVERARAAVPAGDDA